MGGGPNINSNYKKIRTKTFSWEGKKRNIYIFIKKNPNIFKDKNI